MPNNVSRRFVGLSLVVAATILWTAPVHAADPKKTGEQIYQIYVDTMSRSNAVLADTPAPSPEIAAQLDAIKEDAITELVALGRDVADMSDADRATVEAVVSSSVSSIHRNSDTKQVYADYQAVWGAYVGGDRDFFDRIKSLNILTQYAFFDLLRKQAPKEADRLGV
ncbi:hypothetical protein MWU54_11655 [Marivita sp. S6314]|uniref:hypothetical protein n=1 Tax=Marivita sp. S6314 TaxID=2926406 RepID=UPI001FF4E930|nr:hypothetical protein [Marivita sp. S6314]MCK0150683.1 hypothetical protein [Marivita sp. S6314]